MMLETLKEIYYEVAGNDDIEITPKTKISDGLGLSSFGKVQLICAVEERFDIEIPNKVLASFKTVNDIIKYLENNT